MLQLVAFMVSFGVLTANGTGIIAAFIGAVVLSFVISFIVIGIIAAIAK